MLAHAQQRHANALELVVEACARWQGVQSLLHAPLEPRKETEFVYCTTEENVADVMIKPLPECKFGVCLEGVGMAEDCMP